METNDGIDEHIARLIQGKTHPTDIMYALKRDLISRKDDLLETWDEIYGRLPSCREIMGEQYHTAMREKYIATYKACLAESENQ